jgi:hypothetical protein
VFLQRGAVLWVALLLSAIIAPEVAWATISFLPPVPYTQTRASGITTMDLDGDGNLDLAVGDIGADLLSLLYGRGDGSFEAPVELRPGHGYQLALGANNQMIGADVNGDGRLDLIVPHGAAGQVFVYLNQGHRTFAAPAGYPAGGGPVSVTADDFNGDGKPDLAVSNHGSNSLSILLNQGDGTFLSGATYAAGGHPGGVSSADLNSDGKIDLALSTIVGNQVVVYLGDGTGQFAHGGSYGVATAPGHVLLEDFDGDGKLDIATNDWFGNVVSLLKGDGTGKFNPPVHFPSAGYTGVMAAADLDSDGDLDLAYGLGGSVYVGVLLNNGAGSFALPVLLPSGGQDTRTLAAGDFNNDGQPDLAAGAQTSFIVGISLNTTPQPTPTIRSVSLDRASVIGGCETLAGAITLSASAPAGGIEVSLTSTNAAVVVARSVRVPEGETRIVFTPTVSPVSSLQTGTLFASHQGSGKRVAFRVQPGGVAGVKVTPNPVIGGQSATGQVTLPCPAGLEGVPVSLASSRADLVQVPASVQVPAGAFSVTFPVTTREATAVIPVVVTARFNDLVRTDTLEVRPVPPPPPPPPPPPFSRNLLANGSFEEPDVSGSPYYYGFAYGPDPKPGYPSYRGASIPGWRITRGTLDVVKVHWPSADGKQNIDLVGSPGAATIEQSFPTEPGREYILSGYVAHNPGISFGRSDVFLNGVFFVQLTHTARSTTADPKWSFFSYRFRVISPMTTLTISDATNVDPVRGTALDGLAITLADQPAPTTTEAPAAPSGLMVGAIRRGQLQLIWQDNSSSETGFGVWRRAEGADWVRVGLAPANRPSFVDNLTGPTRRYTYRVRAHNNTGASPWSNEVTVTASGP